MYVRDMGGMEDMEIKWGYGWCGGHECGWKNMTYFFEMG